MLQLQRLSLAGFKSFADPVEITFGEGLTGVVGPNGCGKSNVVEALRWVMGESRAKALRGDELEDVIFSGTTLRPARGLAEVRLTFGNPDLDAPAPYTDQPMIEITRVVTRASGSSYKINGRPARARDVQLFLNEANTGSASPAFVTQGQVAALINAKPEARREMIEESAGISGLYVRRKEAEQRLNAASGNLTRVSDIMLGLSGQIETLATQAEDARRYTDLSNRIQILEAAIAHAEWNRLRTGLFNAQETLTAKLAAKNEGEAALTKVEADLIEAREEYSELKRQEEEARAALAAVQNEHVRLSERLSSRSRETELLQTQLNGFDTQDAQWHSQIARLETEKAEAAATLADKQKALEGQDEVLASLREKRGETQSAVYKAEKAVEEARAKLLAAKAETDAMAIERDKLSKRLDAVNIDLGNVANALRDATGGDQGGVFLESRTIETELQSLEEKHRAAVERETALSLEEKNVAEQLDALRPQKSVAEKALAALEAELRILQRTLKELPDDTVLSALRVANGYDRALAVALGEAAQAGLSGESDVYWTDDAKGAELPALHKDLTPLSTYVENAPRLARLLSMVGLATDEASAEKLAPKLIPGQMIVTKSGALWRWDGLRVKDSFVPAAAQTLEARQRAATLEKEISKDAAAIEQLLSHEQELDEQRKKLREQLNILKSEKNQWMSREQQLQGQRRKLDQKIQEHEIKLTGLRTRLSTLDEERGRINARLKELGEQDGTIDPALEEAVTGALNAKIHASEADEQARAALGEAETQSRIAAQETAQLEKSITRIDADLDAARATLDKRAQEKLDLQGKLEALNEDHGGITAELARLNALQIDKSEAMTALSSTVNGKTASLRDLEARQTAAQKTARTSYEAWVESGAKVQTLQTQFEELGTDIESRFAVHDPAELALSFPTPEGTQNQWLSQRGELLDARESLGLINMKAPEEYDNAKTQYDTLDHERTDLAQAIAELSGTIERINKDARARLTATVEQVNALFGPMFVKLFGGGQAELVWTKADDILQAGVEIMAQPPGKKLQTLSLLSGGEQAMCAIALILSMVKTHPAPVCVFDEIDAALDESNVDRVSQALVELAADTGARLIVVSHHRLMMARLDRLYGVTMAERGVSKLVSVDLRREPQLFSEDEGGRLTA